MDRSQQILSAIDEIRQIRKDVRLTESVEAVRDAFERLQIVKRNYSDDFDLQVLIADAQQEVVERARTLRQDPFRSTSLVASALRKDDDAKAVLAKSVDAETKQPPLPDEDAAEIPPEVPKLDKKSWHVAIGLAAFFAVAFVALFVYLIQTARYINFAPDSPAVVTGPQKPAGAKAIPVVNGVPAVSLTPTLRLYTDLIPGTVAIDDQPEQTLVDGEFNLDNIKPGEHSVKVTGTSGSASFAFSLADDKHAPRISTLPVSNNAMVVLVSVQNGQGRLVTDETGAQVSLDAKPAGLVNPTDAGSLNVEGLDLPNLANVDHDLEITQAKDRQRFVLTYTPAPALTVFVKSDPSTGMLVVQANQDEVSVFINDVLYRRPTEHGRLRIPLKVGVYRIRIHKSGFIDPIPARVDVKKSEEASVQFRIQPAPDFATLQVKGAQQGTRVSVDSQPPTTVDGDGSAKIVNIKSGEHEVELSHDMELTKQLKRTFTTGSTVVLSGGDVMLDKLAADNKSVIPANPGPPALPPPTVPQLENMMEASAVAEVVHKGGGFIPYRTPKSAGHYYFKAHTRIGGLLKHGKLQWFAGYHDNNNYVLFTVDGKHANVREVRDGRSFELGKVAFDVNTDEWIQVDVALKPDSIQARVKTDQRGWSDLTSVEGNGRDFTKEGVGLYIPTNDEVAVANFRFTAN